MELFLCANNISVKYVLSYIEEKDCVKGIVITDQINIFDFFNFLALNNLSVLYLDSAIKTWNFHKLLKSKKYVKQLFRSLGEIKTVHYYHQAFGGFFNWIISYSHQKGIPIIFHRSVSQLNMPKAKMSLRYVITKLAYNCFYNTEIDLLDNGIGISPKLSQRFYKKNDIQEEWKELTSTQLQEISRFVGNKYGLKESDNYILVLTGGVMASGQVEKEEYRNKMSSLIGYLGNYKIICKCHPRYNDETDEEKRQLHIDSFVPINLLLPFFQAVIGYNSFTLVEATQIGKKSFSLLNYLKPTNESRKEVGIEYLKKGDVKFPEKLSDILI